MTRDPLFAGESPVQELARMGTDLGIQLYVKRDDLLPFPLPGNKARKLIAEMAASGWRAGDAVVSNGGVESNHARTLAILGAHHGIRVHLVLHAEGRDPGSTMSLTLLKQLGATFDVVAPGEIGSTIARAETRLAGDFPRVHVVPGGAHTKAAVEAYAVAARQVLEATDYEHVFLATGTGATHAGISIGAARAKSRAHVVGASIARPHDRAMAATQECLDWFGLDTPLILTIDDRYTDGGYGITSDATREVVDFAWRRGLPLDGTYTGKAFRCLIERTREGSVGAGTRVLFWHTGGLMNQLEWVHRHGE